MCSIISHRWLLSLAAWANIYARALCHTAVSPHRLLFLGSPENAAILSFWEVVSHWEKTRENKDFFFIQVDCDIMSVVEPEIKLRFGWKWDEVILSRESQHSQQGPGEAAALPLAQPPSQKYSRVQPGSALRITVITSLHSWTLNSGYAQATFWKLCWTGTNLNVNINNISSELTYLYWYKAPESWRCFGWHPKQPKYWPRKIPYNQIISMRIDSTDQRARPTNGAWGGGEGVWARVVVFTLPPASSHLHGPVSPLWGSDWHAGGSAWVCGVLCMEVWDELSAPW